jgi:hypothetical protein
MKSIICKKNRKCRSKILEINLATKHKKDLLYTIYAKDGSNKIMNKERLY